MIFCFIFSHRSTQVIQVSGCCSYFSATFNLVVTALATFYFVAALVPIMSLSSLLLLEEPCCVAKGRKTKDR